MEWYEIWNYQKTKRWLIRSSPLSHFFVVVYLFCLWKDLKYILDHCTKLTKIPWICLDPDLLKNISPHLALKGHLDMSKEVSLEQLKAKLPNLTDVQFGRSISDAYITKFCSDFPLLNTLIIDCNIEGSDNLSTAISSLQNLRKLEIYNYVFTEDQIYTMFNNLTNLEVFYMDDVTLSLQSFLPLARIPRLCSLGINLETACTNLNVLANKNNFPELKWLKIDSRDRDIEYEQCDKLKIQAHLANHRPALTIILNERF